MTPEEMIDWLKAKTKRAETIAAMRDTVGHEALAKDWRRDADTARAVAAYIREKENISTDPLDPPNS